MYHVLVLVGCGGVLGLMVGVELLASSNSGVIPAVAWGGLCTNGAITSTLVNWEITFGAICLIFYVIDWQEIIF